MEELEYKVWASVRVRGTEVWMQYNRSLGGPHGLR